MTPAPADDAPASALPALISHAAALLQSGRVQDAERVFSETVRLYPDSAPAYNGRGIALSLLSRPAEAVVEFRRTIERSPDFAQAHNNLGNALRAQGRHAEALISYHRAIAIHPGFAAAFHHRGISLVALGRHQEALQHFDRAIALEPEYANAFANRGACLLDMQRYSEALESLERAATLEPANAVTFNDRGAAMARCGRGREALASFERAIELAPRYATAHANRAVALSDLSRLDEALDSYQHAAALDPDRAETHSDRAAALLKLNRLDDALSSCERAIALNPRLHDAYWNRGLVRLLSGALEAGWQDFEHRWSRTDARRPRHASIRRWRGDSPLRGRRVVVWSEQGLGDTLQFCRYAPLVRDLGADVVLEVQPAIRSVVSSLSGVQRIIGADEALEACDLQTPLMSLPLAFGTGLSNIPAPMPYLHADQGKVERWRSVIGAGPNIGLVCSGYAGHKNDANRSIPLCGFAPLFGRHELFLLQNEVRAGDEPALGPGRVRDLRQHLDDFSETAALIGCLDLVISVDTAVAHLAGAMGKPVWILLPWAPDWRWMLERSDSPWYPTARLFRQSKRGDWSSVIEQVAADLARITRV